MKPNRLGRYLDVQAILDAALAAGGGTYMLENHGAAVRWRQRAYEFRKAFATTVSHSPYDTLTLPRIDPDSAVVIIKRVETTGTFTPAGPTIDPLLAEAEEIAKNLGLDL